MTDMNTTTAPALYGITRSNRNFNDPYYWGKNQFNSSFPVALACYMRSQNTPLAYIRYQDSKKTKVDELDVSDMFGCSLPNDQLYFAFETRFDAFRGSVHDELPAIDLVIGSGDPVKQLRPIEIKLTTLPDNATEGLDESRYGAELVIRSATTRYMALSMSKSVEHCQSRVKEIFEPVFAKVRNFDSKVEMASVLPLAVQALDCFLKEFKDLQKPMLMQPIWKTVGKSPILANNCLDIFVWSDFALTHLFIDSARFPKDINSVSRYSRAALRLARFLYERSKSEKVFQAPIYDGMTFDNQNDKEFSMTGVRTRELMACDRLLKPRITKDEIKRIILGGGQKYLSPERRFDAILYFSNDLFGA